MKFYICSICGNEIEMIKDSNQTPSCCGRTMRQLIPASTDGKLEKHVPCVKEFCEPNSKDLLVVRVKVGEESHPMEEGHHIEWIVLETSCGVHRRNLTNAKCAEAAFVISKSERPIAVYAYCNLHGLWVSEDFTRE